jgi:translation initiation factor eIF-2B subunit delta
MLQQNLTYLKLHAGDPAAVATVPGRMDINYLDNWTNKENLQLLNLM